MYAFWASRGQYIALESFIDTPKLFAEMARAAMQDPEANAKFSKLYYVPQICEGDGGFQPIARWHARVVKAQAQAYLKEF